MKLSYFVSLTILFLFAFSLSWQWIEKSYVGFISSSVSAISPIEVDIEFVGNLYEYTPYLAGIPLASEDLPWGRVSTYVTLRKEILGLSIPLLAKAQLYGGVGFNKHKVVPIMTADVIKDALGGNDLEAALKLFEADTEEGAKDLAKSMLDNVEDVPGFHLQAGVRGKLLMFNAFVNARYTIAKDVIPDKSGYPSLWVGLAIGI